MQFSSRSFPRAGISSSRAVKFSYHQEPSPQVRPTKSARKSCVHAYGSVFFNKNRFIDLLALVDSGADDCLFPLEVATELNLPLKPKNVNLYGGIGAGHISAVFTHVSFGVAGEVIFPLYAGFSDAPSVVPILGQAGFFDRFEVKFNK